MTPTEQRHAIACVRALEDIQLAADAVTDSWERGDLAAAVRDLGHARDHARHMLQRFKRAQRDVARRDDPAWEARMIEKDSQYFRR